MDKINSGKISNIIRETEDVRTFKLKLEGAFSHKPGQYVMLSYPDSSDIRRAFSIVDYDPKKKELTLIIKKNGAFTQRLFKEKQGAILDILGPYGRFCLPDAQDKPVVMIAGGVGVTPLYSMLLDIKKNGWQSTAHLFYSAKKKEEMVLFDKILGLSNDTIKVNLHLTREERALSELTHKADNESISLSNRRIDLESIKQRLQRLFHDSTFYICGPSAMTIAFRDELLRNGISDSRILSEEF